MYILITRKVKQRLLIWQAPGLDSGCRGVDGGRVKTALVEKIRRELKTRLDRSARAAKESQIAATDPDSKAESKYDTRNLEASYLAAGQARQVEELSQALGMFERVNLPDYSGMGAIGPGALVELSIQGESNWFLLVAVAGGLEVDDGERRITLLSPESRLYQQLLGLAVGETIEQPIARVLRIL